MCIRADNNYLTYPNLAATGIIIVIQDSRSLPKKIDAIITTIACLSSQLFEIERAQVLIHQLVNSKHLAIILCEFNQDNNNNPLQQIRNVTKNNTLLIGDEGNRIITPHHHYLSIILNAISGSAVVLPAAS